MFAGGIHCDIEIKMTRDALEHGFRKRNLYGRPVYMYTHPLSFIA